ncbi:2-succinyl-5-enolpyruvyl-6-hydroxy-3-cyclohexene-1-carboxylic-acid synthase [Flavobacterium sp.]|uniref:2-succinyl-5-enolpyruvyl-6-hydroxy-3- cyclohexene-1-carboxylic-acid synthase n=1 Tax=Flavobacterium sp. TaxID=239 RepID=UPI002607A0D8|nr:2-succinyl-5-enolpyruvyl-6-hydroxy-3-cyclohexene-1-carboxylic-acid synthase [Flavobacterium sp.]MDD3003520.1 2-succinyl-5-enolpyruvyl-6-hydroxy-3-cyclohexene-1-carboxylic-acid synthase [Flavobacterium sp.]
MIYPKIPLAQSIIEIFANRGIHQIVISPGSRNAPLTIGFASNPTFECLSIADERSAAFFALGIAQQTQKPVVVLCTSGSALLNYYPAFAEAFYSQIPLIVVSADRPHDKIDIGDGQTIRQENVFVNHSLFNANLNENVSVENDQLINEAISKAILQKGPVHINVPFEEPLYETTDVLEVKSLVIPEVQPNFPIEDISAFAKKWNASTKKMILVGVNTPNSISQEILEWMANDASVIVLTESTSNLHHQKFISNIDTIITPFSAEDFEHFQPEVLLTFGGMVVSKRIRAFLRKYKPAEHWHIDTLRAYDTFGALSHHFKAIPQQFLEAFLPLTQNGNGTYQSEWNHIKALRKEKQEVYLSQIPFSDLKAFEIILPYLPQNSMLQVSNSSPIRYIQLLEIHPSISVFCNRGTSGIDGSTSTAVGAAFASQIPTVFITGDISFLYDSNGLWNEYIPKNFKIILLNNGGGGIFRILPGHQETPVFNRYFETSHCLTAEHLAKMYQLDYFTASDEISLKQSLVELFAKNEQPAILEIFTPTLLNNSVLQQFFKELT